MANSKPAGSNAWIVAAVMAVVMGTGVFLWARMASTAARRDPIALTPEARAYVRNLKVSDQELKAAESYMKVSIVEVLGKIRNEGDRQVKVVEIYCNFYDTYGQIVLRERLPIVKDGLKPGEEKRFRLPFDTMPESWNQSAPALVIAGIRFGE